MFLFVLSQISIDRRSRCLIVAKAFKSWIVISPFVLIQMGTFDFAEQKIKSPISQTKIYKKLSMYFFFW